jgi:hypothetical protein
MKDRTKFIIGLFVLLATIALGVWQWDIMQSHDLRADTFNTQAATLSVQQNSLMSDYQTIKASVDDTRDNAIAELESVFPTEENITDLNRMFDDFAVKNNYANNPFFISSINYQGEQTTEEGYRYVPANISVTASSKNLGEFMEFIETSGSLEGEVRLMSIEDMSLSYPAEYGGTYEAKFSIKAYFSQDISNS